MSKILTAHEVDLIDLGSTDWDRKHLHKEFKVCGHHHDIVFGLGENLSHAYIYYPRNAPEDFKNIKIFIIKRDPYTRVS
jgi:hypothetical protein